MKNKGFTLIELLVAMAIGAVLLIMLSFMMVQGTKLFNTESDEINLKGDYQIVRNQLDELFMEAKTLVIVKDTSGAVLRVYTGNVDTLSNEVLAVPRATVAVIEESTQMPTEAASEGESGESTAETTAQSVIQATTKPVVQTTERILTYDAATNSLYVSSTYGSATSEGNLLSNLVTGFSVEVNQACLVGDPVKPEAESYYVNPLNVLINLQMEGEQKDMDSEILVRVRNQLREVSIYTVESATTPLENASNVEIIKVK